MKIFIILLLSAYTITIVGQTDTIYANEKKAVALFFPKPIRQGIVGKSNFTFTYNKGEAQYFGLLQATPGKESNLLAITNDGQVYSYILKYSDSVQKLNYFVKKSKSIGNEKPVKPKKKHSNNLIAETESKFAKYANTSKAILKFPTRNLIKAKQKYGIKLAVQQIIYSDDMLYFLMEIKNTSVIDYDINYLQFFTKTKPSSKRKSSQKIIQKPVFTYQFPTRVQGKSKQRFIVCFDKFTISQDKKIQIELNEMGGERDLMLKLRDKVILKK
ncbi:MAG: DUF4138 domain-containing protein [Flavobacteriaceae bacterium]